MTRKPLEVFTRPGLSIGEDRKLDLKLKYPISYHQRVSEIGKLANADVLNLLRYLEEIHIQEERDLLALIKAVGDRVALIKAIEEGVPILRDIDLEAWIDSNEIR